MAVYTPVERSALDAFLAAYDVGTAIDLVPIQEGVENSNYQLVTTFGRFILTIYEKRVDPSDLPFFLGLMLHLAEHGLPCPLPVRGADGTMLRELGGKPAAIVTFLDGRSARRLTSQHCRMVGAALASMHLAGQGFSIRRANALALPGWRELATRCAARADEVAPGLAAEIESEISIMAESWPHDLPAGVIHADLFPDNVFFAGGRVSGLIDFYFACDDLLAYDLAICLNAWCFELDGAFNITKARALVEGYRANRPLNDAELGALPILARGSALRFMLTRLYDWLNQVEGALVKPKDPLEYLKKLRFHRGVQGVTAYGL
ncbi:homoserine kinase [Arboricoccus pini]|uniref:Homoserine kinase n=1 Tax=Arboricoccus pini TaxID=1963835 RepID=A0A212Q270_9PROT|nr:homoserine kinase [Arboricoccus pini]SNB53363.1 homoserine kinase [Arboricoccus pini]